MDIREPLPAWILARLFDEEHPLPRKSLLKTLCQASFDSMTGDNDFADVMKELEKEHYIKFKKETYEDFKPVAVNYGPPDEPPEESSTRFEKIMRTREGYVIEEPGINAFRRQIVTTIKEIKPHVDKLSTIDGKFGKIINSVRSTVDLTKTVTKLCIENTPLLVDFIKSAMSLLYKVDIFIH